VRASRLARSVTPAGLTESGYNSRAFGTSIFELGVVIERQRDGRRVGIVEIQ
jgi:hypothetical protein